MRRIAFSLALAALPAAAAGAPFTRGDLVVHVGAGGLVRVDPTTGMQTQLCAGLSPSMASDWPRAVAFEPGGVRVHVAFGYGLGGVAYGLDPATCAISGAQGALSSPLEGLEFAADGTAYMAGLGALADTTADGEVFRYGPGGAGSLLDLVASGGLLRNATDLVGDAAGMLFVADVDDVSFPGSASSGRVLRIDPATGAQALIAEGGSLVHPAAIDAEASGQLVVADHASQSVVRVDPVTGAQSLVSQYGLLGHPIGVAVEPGGTIVVLSEAPGATLVRVDPVSGAQTLVAAGDLLADPRTPGAISVALPASCDDGLDNDGDGLVDFPADPGCASREQDDETAVCDDDADNDGDGRIDYPADPGCASAAAGQEAPDPVCGDLVDNDGDGLVDYPEDVHCVSVHDATEEPALPAGTALVAEPGATFGCCAADGRIVRVDPATGTVVGNLAAGGQLVDPVAVVVEPDGQLLVADWLGDGNQGRIVRIHPETGAQSVLASGGWLVDPMDLVLDANGDLLVADEDASGGACSGGGCGGVLRIDRATGAQAPVSLGGLFVEPRGIVREASGTLLVSDNGPLGQGQGKVIRVNPTTGAQALVASGLSLTQVQRIGLQANGFALVTNQFSAPRVVRVGAASGGQALHPILVTSPVGVAVEAKGQVLVTDRTLSPSAGFVRRYDPGTGLTTSIAHALLVNPQGIELVPPGCSDGFDNDGDGFVDHPADAGCSAAGDGFETVDCADGLDNDGDGLTDFPVDPGCWSAVAGVEDPACDDGLDNDGDGLVDFGVDPGCAAGWDTTETPPSGCGLGAELALLVPLLRAWRGRRGRVRPGRASLAFGEASVA